MRGLREGGAHARRGMQTFAATGPPVGSRPSPAPKARRSRCPPSREARRTSSASESGVCAYDLRSTFASNSLAAGVTVFELARLMGTSVAMIERHYGTLLEGAGADIARRLSAFEAEQGRARDRATDADP
jgi:hypothetical protein